jgi:putative endonuclease
MKGFIYILKSLKNGQYYVGSTIDVNNRLYLHNSGKVKSTKNSRPYELVLEKVYDNISDARAIEFNIKKLKRRDYIEKMIKDQDIKLGL